MRKGLLVLTLITALVFTVLGGCVSSSPAETNSTSTSTAAISPQASSTPPKTVTIKYPETPGTLNIIRVATELGFAQEEGIKFESAGTTSGGPQTLQAVAAGSFDVGLTTNAIPVINARLAGIKVKFIASTATTYKYDEQGNPVVGGGLIVREDSSITGPKDLVGKKIGVNTIGAKAEYTIRRWLRSANIPFDQVELVVVPIANYIQVFKQGQIDGLYAASTYYDLLKENGEKVEIIPEEELQGGDFGTDSTFFTEEYINKNPDIVKRFLRAYVKAWDWSRENLTEYRNLADKIARAEGGNPDLVKYILANGHPHALLNDEEMNFWINELVIAGKINAGDVKASDLYTNEFNPYYQSK